MLLQVVNIAQLQYSMGMAPGLQVVAGESGTVQSSAPPQTMSAVEKPSPTRQYGSWPMP